MSIRPLTFIGSLYIGTCNDWQAGYGVYKDNFFTAKIIFRQKGFFCESKFEITDKVTTSTRSNKQVINFYLHQPEETSK
jgi:hypothetical protein